MSNLIRRVKTVVESLLKCNVYRVNDGLLMIRRGACSPLPMELGRNYLVRASAGCDRYLSSDMNQFLTDLNLQQVINRYSIDLVLDVGANVGQFASRLRQHIDYKGQIMSFEPVQATFAKLSAAAALDPLWDVHCFALGTEETQATINVADASTFTSFLTPRPDQVNTFGANALRTHQETVTVRRLDNFLDENIIMARNRNVLLKMDTQGYDLQVFSGLGTWVDRVPCILSEISGVPLYDGMPTFAASISVYEHAGYIPASIHTVGVDPKTLAMIDADCLLIRAPIEEK